MQVHGQSNAPCPYSHGNSRGLVAPVRTTGHLLNPKGCLNSPCKRVVIHQRPNQIHSGDARRRARLISVSVGAPSRFRQRKMRLVGCGCEAIRSIHNYLPVLSADFGTGSRFGSWSAVSTTLLLHGEGKTNSRALGIASSYEPNSTDFEARAFGHRTDS